MRPQIYTPGAGHMPPELAGRDELTQRWELMLNRVRHDGRVGAVDTVLVGLRGVGKSALLTRLADLAAPAGFETIRLQGSSETSVVDALRQVAAIRSEQGAGWWATAHRLFGQITGVSVNVAGIGVGVERESTDSVAGAQPLVSTHPEQLAATMADLGREIRAETGGGLVLSVDEFQMTRPEDIRLIGGVLNHLNTAHPEAPVVFLAGGLPNLPQRMVGPDPDHPFITNPERLFSFQTVPVQLPPTAAALALIRPAERVGAGWEPAAVEAVLTVTRGYPAHLQIYAAAAWVRGTDTAPVTAADVANTAGDAAAIIETQYLDPRWARLSGRQQAYLTAIALSGDAASTSAVAATLDTALSGQSKRRDTLIRRGEIFEPQRGRVQLSMPAMREYALRRYPEAVAADPELVTPAEMMANLAAWQARRVDRATAPEGFPEDVITGRPALDP